MNSDNLPHYQKRDFTYYCENADCFDSYQSKITLLYIFNTFVIYG